MSASAEGPLACPRCTRRYPLDERFCADCRMPLVYVGGEEQEPVTDAHERARKVKPQFMGGKLVKVAWARNQAEAELIQGVLLEQGIPSLQRRTRGFDVPDMIAAGPRDILVGEAAVREARSLLGDGREGELADAQLAPQRPGRLLAGVVIAVAGAAAIVWLLYQLTA